MTDLMSIIKGRRSIRRYQDKEVPQEIVERLLDSIRWSPSWANTQCWEIVIVKDPATKEKLKETIGSTNPSSKGIVEAPLVFAICGKVKSSGYYKGQTTTKFGDWLLFDLGIATQSLCLAAFDAGLGTVIIGMLDHDKAKEVLGVEEEYEVVALIPVGYPAKESAAPKRREIGEFTHYGKF
ncbi:MAG: nitroreductase [Deltaproteobacteria bacterium HGW-Deltaproteobacteria-15]|jgi:nitroreductase|nr:MAG: nitroreductase [Deltaproteobacteria bacterium HGW-Deltaproteobacteria-15]